MRWDAASYSRASDVQEQWALRTLDRLPLRGDETVLDAGCGTGGVTEMLLERLPRGRVVAVDSSPEMVEHARRALGDRATVMQADLAELRLDEPVDAIFSNAVFHWIPDQQRLYDALYAALRPGGMLVAQCGGRGNVEELLATVDAVAATEPFAPHLASFERGWRFPGPEDTEERLARAGFDPARAWLESSDATPRDSAAFLRATPLRSWLVLLPEELQEPFVQAVLERCGEPLRVDWVRLFIEARRP